MFEWVHSLRQILPDPVPAILVSLGIFLILEAICRIVRHVIYIKSERYVRDQWRLSRFWDEYRMLEQQQTSHTKSPLPSLERLNELESLNR